MEEEGSLGQKFAKILALAVVETSLLSSRFACKAGLFLPCLPSWNVPDDLPDHSATDPAHEPAPEAVENLCVRCGFLLEELGCS